MVGGEVVGGSMDGRVMRLTYAPKSLLARENSSKTILAPCSGRLRNWVCCWTFKPASAVKAIIGSKLPKSWISQLAY